MGMASLLALTELRQQVRDLQPDSGENSPPPPCPSGVEWPGTTDRRLRGRPPCINWASMCGKGLAAPGWWLNWGGGAGPSIGLRVDMDALPIEERTGLPFASRQQGLMHACGHDIHTTVGIGVAHVMSPLARRLPGTLRLLFQPAEEIAQGASWMVKAGGAGGSGCPVRCSCTPATGGRQGGGALRRVHRHTRMS